jgi:hypothetical protein
LGSGVYYGSSGSSLGLPASFAEPIWTVTMNDWFATPKKTMLVLGIATFSVHHVVTLYLVPVLVWLCKEASFNFSTLNANLPELLFCFNLGSCHHDVLD